MASLRVARRMFCAAAETAAAAPAAPAAPASSSRWERVKNSKAGVWCRSLVSDYKEACREIVLGAWGRPAKATVYLTLMGGASACVYTNPDQSSFEAALLERSNQLGLLSPWIRNATSDGHIQNLVKLRNEGRLQHASLGLLSLVYWANYDTDSALYEAQCSNLSMPWLEFHQRVLDVGFGSRWWILDSKMRDYDVNEDEFKNLPAHMQVSSPPSVQEVEKNERLHKESWLALKVEDEVKEAHVVDRKEEKVSEEQTEPAKEEQT
ncbi:mitochondrial import inner membrane translocase subunit Tim29 [Paralichthys olivaceus]|uniref:mitochondrial import inner membrane translocase subunit Tim29 n=1 Tax=Paralichthys olivaceus TaxID=8255 RepID=UPI00097DC7A4|nr:PREDICTED: mitochondrial import inner membrane translocase subunit Tim29 [Paralichthys olivaceus]